MYVRTPSEENPWFQAMPADWEPDQPERRLSAKVGLVQLVLYEANATMRHCDLVRAVMDADGCSQRTARRAISDAVDSGKIFRAANLYSLPAETRKNYLDPDRK